MNKRDKAILNWTKKNRPDLVASMMNFLDDPDGSPAKQAIYLIACIAFEAGRQFQSDNPALELDNPNVYAA